MKGKHSENNTKIILVVIIIILLIIIAYLLFANRKNEKIIENDKQNISTNVVENTITNENVDNEIQNNENTNLENVSEQENEQVNSTQQESPEERAINIVKNDWGDGAVVYFNCVGRDEKGRYIIVIADAETTRAIQWYYVDLQTGEFEIVNN